MTSASLKTAESPETMVCLEPKKVSDAQAVDPKKLAITSPPALPMILPEIPRAELKLQFQFPERIMPARWTAVQKRSVVRSKPVVTGFESQNPWKDLEFPASIVAENSKETGCEKDGKNLPGMVEISGVSACSGPPNELQNKRPDFDREPASVVPVIPKKLDLPKPVEAEKDRPGNPAIPVFSGPPQELRKKCPEVTEKSDPAFLGDLMKFSIQNPTDIAVLDPPASPFIPATSVAQIEPGNNLKDGRKVEKPTSPDRPENLKELSVKKPAVAVGHDQGIPAKSVPQIDTGRKPPIPRTPSVPRNRPSRFSEPNPKIVPGARSDPGSKLVVCSGAEKPAMPTIPEISKESGIQKPPIVDECGRKMDPTKSGRPSNPAKKPESFSRASGIPKSRPDFRFSMQNPRFVPVPVPALSGNSNLTIVPELGRGVPKSRPDFRFSMQNPKFVPDDRRRGNIGPQPNPWMPVNQPFGRGDCTGFWRPEPMGMGPQNFRGIMQGNNGGRPSRPIPLMSVNFEPRKVQTVLVFLVRLPRKFLFYLQQIPEIFSLFQEEKNPIQRLYEFTRWRGWPDPIFACVVQDGPPHNRFFVYKV